MDHPSTTIDQFTHQAVGFATAAAMNDADAIQLLLTTARARTADTVLDVACGPGIVAAAFARKAAEVTGIDLTPAMIDLARERCVSERLDNVRFEIGDVERLPCVDAFPRGVPLCAASHAATTGRDQRDGACLRARRASCRG